jgi:CRISPR/Cas system-associated endonuclease/helicase Cas3
VDRKKRVLIMANTRKKTADIFNRITEEVTADNNKQKVLYYISRGIRKKDRIKIIDELTPSIKEENYKANIIVVSTQVIEAGIDLSFSHIYREAAPLDSVIQIMGRLNREGEYKYDSYMAIFQEEVNHRPYSELEYNESVPILKKVKTSEELYAQLPDYYKAVSTKNARNKKMNDELNSYISEMDFVRMVEFQIKAYCSGVALEPISNSCIWPHPGGVPIPIFVYEEAFITGSCSGKFECGAEMGPDGASVEANYYWKCLQAVC